MKKILVIGKIVGVHGIRGALKVMAYTGSMDFFNSGCRLQIGKTGLFTVEWAKPYKQGLLVSLISVDNPDKAGKLVGEEILIDRQELPKPEDDEYYWADLIGMSVFTMAKDYLGRIESIIPTGSNDVFVVKNGEKEVLIPALQQVVKKVDTDEKTMLVDLPEEG